MSVTVIDRIDGYTEVSEALMDRGIPDLEMCSMTEWFRWLFRDYIRLHRKVESLEEALAFMKE